MTYSIDTKKGMEDAIKWTTEHLAKIRDGGVWIIPRSYAFYRVHHGSRTVVRLGLIDESTEKVFAAMGWKLEKAPPPEPYQDKLI